MDPLIHHSQKVPDDFQGQQQLSKNTVQNAMTAVNIASLPFRAVNTAVDYVAESVCSTHPTVQKACDKVGKVFEDIGGVLGKMVPQQAADFPVDLALKYNLPLNDTSYAAESAMILGSALIVGGAAKIVKKIKVKKRGAVSSEFNANPVKFESGIKEFSHDARLEYCYVKKDHTLNVYIQWLASQEIKKKKSSGTVGQALSAIKEIAQSEGAKDVYLQWYPTNRRLYEFALKSKKLTYIGNFEKFKPGHLPHLEGTVTQTTPFSLPVFKLNSYKLSSIALPILGVVGSQTFADDSVVKDLLSQKLEREFSKIPEDGSGRFMSAKLSYWAKQNRLRGHLNEVLGDEEASKVMTDIDKLIVVLENPKVVQEYTKINHMRVKEWNNCFKYIQRGAQVLGSPGLAKAATVAKIGCDIYGAVGVIRAMGAAAPLAMVAPHMSAIIFAGITLSGLFQDEDESNSAFNELLLANLHHISAQIEQTRDEMHHRFNHLDKKVVDLHLHLRETFKGLTTTMVRHYSSLCYDLKKTEHDLSILWKELEYKHDQLFLLPLQEHLDTITFYKERHGTDRIPSKKFGKLCTALERWLLIPPNSCGFNGTLYLEVQTPRKINQTLTIANLEALLGYLAGYAEQKLSIQFPKEIDLLSLPNLAIWQTAAKAYIKLRSSQSFEQYDIEGKRLEAIIKRGTETVQVIEILTDQTSQHFVRLIENYKNEVAMLKAIEENFLDNKRQESLVNGNLQRLNELSLLKEKIPNYDTNAGMRERPDVQRTYVVFKDSYYQAIEKAQTCDDWFDQPMLKQDKSIIPNPFGLLSLPLAMPYPKEAQMQAQYQFFSLPLLIDRKEIVEKIPMIYKLAVHFSLGKFECRYKIKNFEYKRSDNGPVSMHFSVNGARNRTSAFIPASMEYFGTPDKNSMEMQLDLDFVQDNGTSTPVLSVLCQGDPPLLINRFNEFVSYIGGMSVQALTLEGLWKDPKSNLSIQLKNNDRSFEATLRDQIIKVQEDLKDNFMKELIATPIYQEQFEKMESSLNILRSYVKLADLGEEVLQSIEAIHAKQQPLDFIIDENCFVSSYQNWAQAEDFSRLTRLIQSKPMPENPFVNSMRSLISRLHGCILQLNNTEETDELDHLTIEEIQEESNSTDDTLLKELIETMRVQMEDQTRIIHEQNQVIQQQNEKFDEMSKKIDLLMQAILKQQTQ